MTTDRILIFTVLAALMALPGCWKDPDACPAGDAPLRVSLSVDGDAPATRSVLPENDSFESTIRGVSVFAYNSATGEIAAAKYFTTSRFALTLTRTVPHTIYVLANMGDLTATAPKSELDLVNYSYDLVSYASIQSKGMELAAYEPRRAVGQGLGYAVANRGGCHLNGGYLVVLEGLGMNVNGQTPRGKADLCMVMQDLMESISCGGQCLFTSYGVLPAFMVRNPNGILQRVVNAAVPFVGPAVRVVNKLPEIACFNIPLIPYPLELRYTTGMKLTLGQFIRIGERSYNVERAVNARFGVSAANDKLPKRLTDVPQDPKNPKTKVPLEQMKKTYYRARGWGKNGLPGEKKLRRLGIR